VQKPGVSFLLQELLPSGWDVRSAGVNPIPGQRVWKIAHHGILAAARKLNLNKMTIKQRVFDHRSTAISSVLRGDNRPDFVPHSILVMEQAKVDPIRAKLRTLEATWPEPSWVLLNVRDLAFDTWDAAGRPTEADDPYFLQCQLEYDRLYDEFARRLKFLSENTALLQVSASPFTLY
jgi:hypothetical protein